ncbi:MAG TPA: hypothetical protein PKA63_13365 [Oligoflexia bacterium]|nr:hypothetical protein [Oligoflexia bacterium]HMP49650.1 hypothetical protein [Oligoflexia bacterium]
MTEKIDKVIALIDAELSRHGSDDSAISRVRNLRLNYIREYLLSKGFPKSEKDKMELSLHPFYFQEVNYDDLDIYSINGDRGHLTIPYDIDLAVQTGGYSRDDVSINIFNSYTSSRSRAIDYWQNKKLDIKENLIAKILKYLKRIKK